MTPKSSSTPEAIAAGILFEIPERPQVNAVFLRFMRILTGGLVPASSSAIS